MEIKQNPFSLYDFLGYLIPGSLFLYGIIFVKLNFNLECFYNEISRYKSVNVYIPFIIVSYISGHLISFLSSYTVEKLAVWKYGYPSKFLLTGKIPKYFLKNNTPIGTVLRIILPIILFPIFLNDIFFGNVLHLNYWNNRALDKFSVDFIKAKSNQIFDSLSKNTNIKRHKINPEEVDFFTILHHFTFERTKTHNPKFQNYVALYGFLRCISFLFVIFFWVNVYFFIKNEFSICDILVFKTICLFILPYLFFLSFLKFYKRYSLETLMAMTTLDIEYEKALK